MLVCAFFKLKLGVFSHLLFFAKIIPYYVWRWCFGQEILLNQQCVNISAVFAPCTGYQENLD